MPKTDGRPDERLVQRWVPVALGIFVLIVLDRSLMVSNAMRDGRFLQSTQLMGTVPWFQWVLFELPLLVLFSATSLVWRVWRKKLPITFGTLSMLMTVQAAPALVSGRVSPGDHLVLWLKFGLNCLGLVFGMFLIFMSKHVSNPRNRTEPVG